MFEVESSRMSELFMFGYGGFQGARGANTGGDFFIENLFEVGSFVAMRLIFASWVIRSSFQTFIVIIWFYLCLFPE